MIILVGSRKLGKRRPITRHYVDTGKFQRLSECTALCGKPGTELIRYDAVYFNYEEIYPHMCKRCEAIWQSMKGVDNEDPM